MNQPISIAERAQVERSFLTRTFLWMTLGLLVTSVVAYVVASSETLLALIFGNPVLLFGLVIGQIVTVLVLSFAVTRISPILATLLFFLYAALTGLTFSSILLVYTAESVASTFVVTAGMFGILTIIGMSTQVDLTGLGILAFIGLIGVILMSIVNFFVQSTVLYWIISVIGVIIFVVLIARDAQRLKQMATQLDPNSDQGARASIMGALALYLDFINLFLFLLRFLGRRN
ncbi:MAG: Bax inhibitor-1/YccA family protein [Chloroflexi bacterium]|nr:Bax inhibitor-1/YccA family protein [Chloroflexota bacterium]